MSTLSCTPNVTRITYGYNDAPSSCTTVCNTECSKQCPAGADWVANGCGGGSSSITQTSWCMVTSCIGFPASPPSDALPAWAIALIAVAGLLIVAGAGTVWYRTRRRRMAAYAAI